MENLYLSNIFCMSELIYLIRYEKIYDTKRGTCVMEKGLIEKSFTGCLIATRSGKSMRKKEVKKCIPGLCKLKI